MKRFSYILILLTLLSPTHLNANMGEPVFPGTLASRPFLSRYVHILKEDLFIEVDKDFQRAKIKAIYHINSEKDGISIPLLFYASDYQEEFQVYVDGQPVSLRKAPYDLSELESVKFKNFDYFYKTPDDSEKAEVLINESNNRGFYISLNDMKYFETDLSQGEHKIEVTYSAKRWKDSQDWVNDYSFRYSLSPAKYWKSFGEINITLSTEYFDGEIETNLGQPINGSLQSVATWHFNELPTEVIQIRYKPEISVLSKVLLAIKPWGASLIFGVLLITFNIKLVKSTRLKRPNKRQNRAVVVGSILAPIAILVFWGAYIYLIKASLREHSGMGLGAYGLLLIPVLTYPFLLPIYGLIVRTADRNFKRLV